MKVIDVIEKAKNKDVEEVTLNYCGDIVKFDNLWDFETESYNMGIDEEEVAKYRFKNNCLYIEIN